MTIAALALEAQNPELQHSLREAIVDTGIPPRPAILLSIQEQLSCQEPDFNQLAETISRDVALAAGIMKVANSPYFRRMVQARTVQQSITALGLELSARAITGLMLRRVFPHVPALDRFWESSARLAQLSSWLHKTLYGSSLLDTGEAYTFGLFRDCGIAVLLSSLPAYEQTLAIANADGSRSFTTIEDDRHPCNHAQLGTMLARSWCLPEASCLAIHYHHDLPALLAAEPGLPEQTAVLIAVTQLAENLLQQNAGQSPAYAWRDMGAAYRAVLGINEREQELLAQQTQQLESDSL